jgi:flagellar biosynthesis GTPase FlhF
MKELKEFDSLSADITLFVAPAKDLRVIDPRSSQSAIVVAQTIKDYLNKVESKRKELVGPLNTQVKAINDYCKKITSPLLEADCHVRSELNAFAAEQERIRRAEEARIERERQEAERKAREERELAEEELRKKQEEEVEAHAEAARLFGPEGGDIETANEAINQKLDREWAEKKAELDRNDAIRANEFKQREWDANQVQIKNTRANLKVRVVDINLIPKEFLIVTPNEKALVAVGKTGAKIPGVEFYEDISVAIGRTTRMPKVV